MIPKDLKLERATLLSVVHLEPGEKVSFTIRDEIDVETTSIRVHYDELINSVKVGSLITLDNGLLNFKVLAKTKNELECIVLDGGKLAIKGMLTYPALESISLQSQKKTRKILHLVLKKMLIL